MEEVLGAGMSNEQKYIYIVYQGFYEYSVMGVFDDHKQARDLVTYCKKRLRETGSRDVDNLVYFERVELNPQIVTLDRINKTIGRKANGKWRLLESESETAVANDDTNTLADTSNVDISASQLHDPLVPYKPTSQGQKEDE